MAFPRIGGSGVGFTNAGLATTGGGVQVGFTDSVTLAAGEVFNIPAGTYMAYPGPYTYLQWLDPVSGIWKTMNTAARVPHAIDSDGANWRLANQTGCVVGALITTGGAGLTNGIGLGSTVTAISAISCSGSPTFSPIVGGALSTSGAPAVLSSGSNYTFPPIVIIDAPPAGGIQATATCLISGGFLSASGSPITYINQGAGYTTVPNIVLINDPRDTTGAGATVTGGALTGSGVLTGLLVTNHGSSFTASGAAPAITFTSSGSTAPTAIPVMNYVVNSFATTTGPDGLKGGSAELVTFSHLVNQGTGGVANAGSLVVGNPSYDVQLTLPRPARLTVANSGGALSTGANATVLEDQGLGIQRVPQVLLFANVTGSGTAIGVTLSVSGGLGGVTDSSILQRT